MLTRTLALFALLSFCGALFAQGYAFSSSPGAAIPDNSNVGADSTINVPNSAPYNAHQIGALQIGVRINHTDTDNLDIYLVPPGVTWNRVGGVYAFPTPAGVIELSTDNSNNGTNFGSGAVPPFTYARLGSTVDPVFTSTLGVNGGGATAPFTATIYTVEDTADFNARYRTSPVGDWKLVVLDDAGGPAGTLVSWEVRYLPQVFADPNAAIPDGSRTGVTSTINVPASGDLIRSFHVGVRITHGTGNQLDMYLIPPWASWSGPYTLVNSEFSGGDSMNAPFPRRVIELSTDNGGGADFGSGAASPYNYARFSAATDPVAPATQAITAGTSAFTTNVYVPEGVDFMEDVYGRPISGNWTLVVADDTAGTAGTLVSWEIVYEPVGANTLYAHLGANNDPGLPIQRGQAGQVLGQFRFDAVGAGTTITSLTFRESAAVNLNTLLSSTALYRDNNGDGLLDGGDTLLSTVPPAASPNVSHAISEVLAADTGVNLLLTGTVLAAPAPVSMQIELQNAAAISSSSVEQGIFPRRAGPRPFVTTTTFTYRPSLGDLIPDNTDTGITRSITVPATSDRINSMRVGVRLNGTYDSDLDFYLLPPGVTWLPPYSTPNNGPVLTAPPQAIELCTDNGGDQNNFGVDLTPYTWTYTRFSGQNDPTWPAATAITAGAAPFTAAAQYRPEGATAWNLVYNSDPSGTWQLIVVDAWGQDVSCLVSWQLEYVPITTPQFWANVGNNNNPGLPATVGTAGNVFGQLELSSYNGANSITQVTAREANGQTISANLSALFLYRDVNNNGTFESGTDTLVSTAGLAGAVATFNIAPAFNIASGTTENLILVGTVLATPANTVLTLRLATNADIVGSASEIAPYPLEFGGHPLNPPFTYISTPPGGITIPSNNAAGITNTIIIPPTQDLIGALRIGFRIDHTVDAELDIWLIPPGVTWAGPYTTINNGANVTPPAGVIELSTDNGAGSNFGTGATIFNYTRISRNGDRQFNTGASLITGGTAPFTAASGYQSEDTVDFNALYGTNPSGAWTIAIGDDTAGNQGRLISWFVQYVPGERVRINSVPTAGFSDFGNVIVNSPSAAQGFQGQNAGNFSLTIPAPSATNGIRITGPNAGEFAIQGVAPSGALAAGASTATFNIVFTPTAAGLRTAFITVTWNTSDATMPPSLTSNYAIQGTGVLAILEVRETDPTTGALVANGAAAANGRAFGNWDIASGATAALTIYVKNTGTAAMTLSVPALGGANPGDFVINTAGFPASIPGGGNATFTIAFDPTALGARSATISFTHNASNTASPFSFALSGTGVQPTVTVVAAGSPSETGTVSGTYTITASPAPPLGFTRTLNFSMGGTAANGVGVDYNLSGVASYAAGSGTVIVGSSGSVVITLTPVDDTRVEATESAIFSLTAGADYTLGVPSNDTLNIADNDNATVTITFAGSPAEPATTGTFTISTGQTLEIALTVNFTMSGVASTTPGTDYNLNSTTFPGPTGTATLPIGVAPSVVITLTPVNDVAVEGPESATMTLNAGVKYVVGAPAAQTHSIADNDNAAITMSSAGAPSETGPANGTYTITATPGPIYAMSVNISLSGTAQFGGAFDYTIAGAAITTPAGGSGPWVGTVNFPGGGGAFQNVVVTLTPVNDARVEATESAQLAVTADTLLTDPGYTGTPSQTRNITDNDTATVTIASAGSPAEPATTGTYTISTAQTLEVALTINFTQSGAASTSPGVDYNLNSTTFPGPTGTATLPIGVAPSVIVTLTPVNDGLVEGPEDAVMTLNAGAQYVIGGGGSASLTIADNDISVITMSFAGTPGEPATTGTYTITATPQPASNMSVNISMSGAAQFGAAFDYTLSGGGVAISSAPGGAGPWVGTVTIPGGAGASVNVVITLTPNNDAIVEASEAAQLAVTADTVLFDPPYSGTPSETLSISDNDTATVTVTSAGSPSEAGATGTFNIATTSVLETAVTVNFTISGAADFAPGNDYNLSGTASYAGPGGTATLAIGAGSSVIVTLTPVNDARVEATESAILTVNTAGQVTAGVPASATLNIADNDAATVIITAAGSPAEPATTGSFTISTAQTLEVALTINFTMSGTASSTPGVDFNLNSTTFAGPAGTATLPIGVGPNVVVTLTPVNDASIEAVESAIMTLNAGSQYVVGVPGNDTLNIADNDAATVTVAASGSPSETGPVGGTYTISTPDTLEVPLTINFTQSGTAAFAAGSDYNLSGTASYAGPSGTATLPAGVAPNVVITLTPVNDARIEATESATMTLNAGAQYVVGAPGSDTLNITDDDVATVIVSSAGSPAEPATTGSYLISTAQTLEIALTINFTQSGTASTTPGVDYNLNSTTFAGPTGTATLGVGVAPSTLVTLTPVDDARVESTESATMTLNAGVKYVVGAPSSDTLNIADNDNAVVTVAAAGSPGEPGTTGTFTVTTTSILDVAVVVSFTMGGTASTSPGVDYNLSGVTTFAGPGGTVTLPIGTGTNVVVTLTPVNSANVEASETATMTLNAGAQVTVGAPGSDSLTITDDDIAVIAIASAGSPAEPATTGTYTITTGATLDIPLSINFTMSGAASSTPGVDYNLNATTFPGPTGTATLPAGVAPGVIVTLTPVGDALVEGPEVATMTLNAGVQYSISGAGNASLTIADNNACVITMASAGTPAEPGTTGTYTITATPQPASAMSVNISLSGSAQFGAAFDYTVSGGGISIATAPGGSGPWVGTVTFPGGGAASVNIIVTLTPNDDAIVEASESAQLAVTAQTVLTDPPYTGTPAQTLNIADNDTATVTVTSAGSPDEPGTTGSYTISTTATLETPVVVTFTMSGTASTTPGTDYNLNSTTFAGPGGTATLPVGAGSSVIVTLTPVDDARVEGTESATLTVNTAGQAVAGAPAAAALNIADNDVATVSVTSAGAPSEPATTGTYTIAATAIIDVPITVNFTQSGSASSTPGVDYNLNSTTFAGPGGTVTLPAGTNPSVIVTLTPVNDVLVEAVEVATMTLGAGALYVIGSPAADSLSISDNDVTVITMSRAGSPSETGPAAGTFTVTATPQPAAAITVDIALSGLAQFGGGFDYTIAGATISTPAGGSGPWLGTVTIPGGGGAFASVIVTLTPVNDATVEGPETAILDVTADSVTTDPAYSGTPGQTHTIADNDTTAITVVAAGSPDEQGPVNGTYTITASPAPARNMIVNFAMSGSASFTAGGDYTLAGTATFSNVTGLGTVIIGVSGSVVVTLQTIDDAAPESTETATLSISADTDAGDPAYTGTPNDNLSILDNDTATVTVAGGPLTFGGAEIGSASAAQSYTVSGVNLTADIVVAAPAQFQVSLSSTGPWTATLNLTPSSGTVAPTSVFVRFAPTSLGAAGGNVSNSSAGAVTQDVAVSGTGTGIAVVGGPLSFGNTQVGAQSAAQSYTVQGEGLSANLDVTPPAQFQVALAGTGPWFGSLSLVPSSGSVAVTSIFVRFAPTVSGLASGNVTNASTGYVTRNVAVDGNGTAGTLGVLGTQDFGSTPVTTTSPTSPITYTISNTATGPSASSLTVTSVTLAGANPGDFALSNFSTSLPTVLAPGQSFTFDGSFTPTAQGARNANIVINSDTGGLPFTNVNYAITGTGTPALFAAAPTFPTTIDSGGPVIVQCVISAIANTVADVAVEYRGGAAGASWTPAITVQTNLGTISGNSISGLAVTTGGVTLEIYWDAYASERHVTASNYQIRFTPSNGTYGQGTTGTSANFTLSRNAGWANHFIPVDALTGRFGHVSIYDAANDRMIVFGGKFNNALVGDVWAYNRGGYAPGWHRLSPAGTPPSARQYSAAVYDATGNRMVLFGGYNGTARVNDLWALSLTPGSETWTQLSPAGGPPQARYFHNFLLDAARSRAILFGGSGSSNLNDVWALSLAVGSEAWTAISPGGTAPSGRYGANACIDAPRDRMVIFGGDTASGAASSQTFALSLAPASETWSTLAPAGTPPSARFLATCGYAANREGMLVESGYGAGFSISSDSWFLDFASGPAWTQISQDPVGSQGRVNGTAVYDASRGQIVAFGGLGSGGTLQNSLAFLATAATPSWSLPASPTVAPPTPDGRYGATMIFDTRYMPNGRIVLFGGRNTSTRYNDVWWIDPSAATPVWTKMNVAGTPPSARAYASAVFDPTAGVERMIVFGGLTASASLNDTWVLDLSAPGSESWTQWSVASPPNQRYLHAAAFDSAAQRMIVCGGFDFTGRTNDVWVLTLSPLTWTKQVVSSGSLPPVRYGHGASYDAATNRLVIFNGNGVSGRLADCWAFDLSALTWANISASGPSARESSALGVVAAGNRVYLHGGYTGAAQSDLWQLDIPAVGAVTWTQLVPTGSSPIARYQHVACLSPAGTLFVGLGFVGITPMQGASDLWSINPAGPLTWQQIGQSTLPRGLVNSADAFDAANRRMIVFGGLIDGVLDDTLWQLDLASPIAQWSKITPATATRPSPRRGAKFFYDAANNRLLMFGGFLGLSTATITNEFWALSLTPGFETWTQLSIPSGPPALANYTVIHDAANSRMVLFGGALNSGFSNATWALSLSGPPAWTQLATTNTPPARMSHTAVYDPFNTRMLVFAGYNGSVFGDFWSLNLTTNAWSSLVVANTPSARYYHSAVYDSTPGAERMILFGGYSTLALGDCYELDMRSGFPLAWSGLGGTVARPQPRWAQSCVFDSVEKRVVLTGGYADGEIPIAQPDGVAEAWFYGR